MAPKLPAKVCSLKGGKAGAKLNDFQLAQQPTDIPYKFSREGSMQSSDKAPQAPGSSGHLLSGGLDLHIMLGALLQKTYRTVIPPSEGDNAGEERLSLL